MSPYQSLANAIVAQAAGDYRYVLRLLKRHPEDSRIQESVREYEGFFHSDWYGVLTNVDPDYLIRRIKKSIEK